MQNQHQSISQARRKLLAQTSKLSIASLASGLLGCNTRQEGYFPMQPGWKWEYAVTTVTEDNTLESQLVVENTKIKQLEAGFEALERKNSLGTKNYLVSDGAGIYRVAKQPEYLEEPILDDDKQRIWVYKTPLKVGTFWLSPTHPYLLKRAMDWPYELKYGKEILMNYEIVDLDASVDLKIGRFEHCLVIQGMHAMRLYTDPVTGWNDVPIVTREWYAPNIGLIKLSREEKINSRFYQGGTITHELSAWHTPSIL